MEQKMKKIKRFARKSTTAEIGAFFQNDNEIETEFNTPMNIKEPNLPNKEDDDIIIHNPESKHLIDKNLLKKISSKTKRKLDKINSHVNKQIEKEENEDEIKIDDELQKRISNLRIIKSIHENTVTISENYFKNTLCFKNFDCHKYDPCCFLNYYDRIQKFSFERKGEDPTVINKKNIKKFKKNL